MISVAPPEWKSVSEVAKVIDQKRDRSMNVRTRPTTQGPPSRMEANDGAVAVLVELLRMEE